MKILWEAFDCDAARMVTFAGRLVWIFCLLGAALTLLWWSL